MARWKKAGTAEVAGGVGGAVGQNQDHGRAEAQDLLAGFASTVGLGSEPASKKSSFTRRGCSQNGSLENL